MANRQIAKTAPENGGVIVESYLSSAFFNRLETLTLHMQPNLRGFFGGKHLVKSYGQTIDFADYREYVLGDDIRRIDWNLYSRFKKYYLKLFTDERQMHVQIFLDCSASMGLNPDKGRYIVSLMAALGYLAVRCTDKLSLYFIRGDRAEDPFGKIIGKETFFRAIARLGEIEFDGEADFEPAITGCESTGSKDGLSVIISDFMTDSDWKRATKFLRNKGRQVLLLQVLTPEEAEPDYLGRNHLIDVETTDIADERNLRMRISRSMLLTYEQVIREIYDDMHAFSVANNVDYVSARTNVPIEKLIFGKLMQNGIIS